MNVRIFLFLVFVITINCSLISIDFGTEWLKVASIKRGSSMDIVLNKEAKRKTPNVLTVLGRQRYFGSESASLATRYPKDTYPNLKTLLGRLFNDSHSVLYRETFDNTMKPTSERGTVSFDGKDGVNFTVEELVAMVFGSIKKMAESHNEGIVVGAVIVVPPYFSQFERQAIRDAAAMADLKLYGFISDQTAVALSYALRRPINETIQYHVFYDIGSGSSVASLIQFQEVSIVDEKTKTKKKLPQVLVKSTGFDKTLGGHEIDVIIQKHLAELFLKNNPQHDVFANPRAMSKLLKEANRVKHILSANTETVASVENVMNDANFKAQITRKTLDSLCAPLIPRFLAPIKNALSQIGLDKENITSFVLVGGGTRVPFIQSALKNFVGDDKISKNVNADEEMAMGAIFHAASLSGMFKVKEINVKDLNLLPIDAVFTSSRTNELTQMVLYDRVSFGKKFLNLKQTSDFDVLIKYSDGANVELTKDLFTASIKGVENAFNSFKNENVTNQKVRLLFNLDENGIVSIERAFVVVELDKWTEQKKKNPSIVEKITKFFTGSNKTNEETNTTLENDSTEEVKEEESVPEETPTPKVEETEWLLKKVTETRELELKVTYHGIRPLNNDEFKHMRKRLKEWDAEEELSRKLSEAKNNLESKIYSVKDDVEWNSRFQECSTENERAALLTLANAFGEWLDSAETTQLEEYESRLQKLVSITNLVDERIKQLEQRPSQVTILLNLLANSVKWADEVKQNFTEEKRGPQDKDLDSFQTFLQETGDWLKELQERQEKLLPNQESILTVSALQLKFKEIEIRLSVLAKMRPPKPKSTVTSTSSDAQPTETSTDEESEKKEL